MASNRSHTITSEQVRAKYKTLKLKLKSPMENSIENERESERMLNDLQSRVNRRFDTLVKKFVIDDNEQINTELLDKLNKVKDPNTFLEAVLTHLYGKAVKQEEDEVSPKVNDEEKPEIDKMVEQLCEKQNKQ
ncbi:hypothetical protein I4U23_011095 [Adineta vaga]|nr:hypothetical protein I4U23_011095 [Adineta vaga]